MSDTPEPATARFKRRPVLAFVLNGLTMGLGHVYLGRPRRALLFFSAVATLQLALFLAVFLAPPSAKLGVFLPGFGLLLVAHLLGALDAFRLARRLGRGVFDKHCFNRVPIYLAYFVLGALLSFSLTRLERRHLVNIYRVTSNSMSPTLLNGDYLLADRQFNCVKCWHALALGDIVVFDYEGSIFVKRVVGLPKDEVQISNQVLSVSGDSVLRVATDALGSAELERFHKESNIFEESLGSHFYLTAWGELEGNSTEIHSVSANAVFVLGDNRDRSKDSRELGPIPLASILGRVDQIWLSQHWRDGRRSERSGISFPTPRTAKRGH